VFRSSLNAFSYPLFYYSSYRSIKEKKLV